VHTVEKITVTRGPEAEQRLQELARGNEMGTAGSIGMGEMRGSQLLREELQNLGGTT